MNRSHTDTIALFRRAIDTIDHRCCQASLEWFRLSRPVRISAGYHNSAIATGNRNKFLGIWFPSLDIQHTVTDVLKIDE
jgi:hypothetical protein